MFFSASWFTKKNTGYRAIACLRHYIRQLAAKTCAKNLFSEKPLLHFYPEEESCPCCGSKLKVLKTREKTLATLDIGAFRAKETVLECPQDGSVYGSKELRGLVPKRCQFGFDVLVYVGKALFIRSKNEQEILNELAEKNIMISDREISNLGKKFIIYLALAHRESQYELRRSMARRGGYILHIDGTCDSDSPVLFCGLDGISELVLDAIKIPSEKKDLLVPFFKRIKEQYGIPAAVVHDMGVGIISAVAEVFPGVLDYICHFHFLRDIGKDLLLGDYKIIIQRLQTLKLRSLLRQKARYLGDKIQGDSQTIADLAAGIENGQLQTAHLESIPTAVVYALIHWAFEAPSRSKGYGFPFDRPHFDFYRRLTEVYDLLGKIMSMRWREKAKDNRPFITIYHLLKNALADKKLIKAAASLEEKSKVFDKLRNALRIAPLNGKNGLNDDGDETDIKTIEQKVTEFRAWLVSDEKQKKDYSKMIEQLDKYWDKLFTDPLVVNTPQGQITIFPQRTNNILEQFFRGEKRRARKKSGTSSLNKMLKTILADTPLVRNLENEEYRQIILNGYSTLAERFVQIDADQVVEQLKHSQSSQEKITPEVKKIIKRPDLPEKILTLFNGV